MLKRVHQYQDFPEPDHTSKVVYWMERDHRVYDNHALAFAQEMAKFRQQALEVAVLLCKDTITMQERQVSFAIEGLKCVEKNLMRYNIALKVFTDFEDFYEYLDMSASRLITDFNPLKRKVRLIEQVKKLKLPIHEVDSHNIVPCRYIYDLYGKQVAARTIRPRINKFLLDYLDDFPNMVNHDLNNFKLEPVDWARVHKDLDYGYDAKKLEVVAGEAAALSQFMAFMKVAEHFSDLRNNPEKDYQSGLSVYLHFGHISAQRLAYLTKTMMPPSQSKDDFLEQLIIRKELTDNYCINNELQDKVEGFDNWALKTLEDHKNDPRDPSYSLEEFEKGLSYDPIWNAAQLELVKFGNIHGYLRMYWAKKILEWSKDYKTAFETALYLNDKYALDGNDPNGLVGIAWSIGGVHDHGWKERPVFGKIRYMNDKGCKRKFDVDLYINRIKN